MEFDKEKAEESGKNIFCLSNQVRIDHINNHIEWLSLSAISGVATMMDSTSLELEVVDHVNVMVFGSAALKMHDIKCEYNDIDMFVSVNYQGKSSSELHKIASNENKISDVFSKDQESINDYFHNVFGDDIDYDVTNDEKLFNISEMCPKFPVEMGDLIRKSSYIRSVETLERFSVNLYALSLESIFLTKVLASRDKDIETLKMLAGTGRITPEGLLEEVDKLAQFNTPESIHETLQLLAPAVLEAFNMQVDPEKAIRCYELFEARVEFYAHAIHGDTDCYMDSDIFPSDDDFELEFDDKNYSGFESDYSSDYEDCEDSFNY